MIFSKKLVKLRKEKKLSQDTLAEALGTTRQTISSWENDKSYPDLQMIVKISDEFNISLDELLKEDVMLVRKIDGKAVLKRDVKNFFIALYLIALAVMATIIVYFCVLVIYLFTMKEIKIPRTKDPFGIELSCVIENSAYTFYIAGNPDDLKPPDYVSDTSIAHPIEIVLKHGDEKILEKLNINLTDYNSVDELEFYIEDYFIASGGKCRE